MNRIFVTGDIHGDITSRVSNKSFQLNKELDKTDLMIFVGDFGLIWNKHENKHEKYLLDWLNKRNFTTLFIGGNHENWDRLRSLPIVEKFGVKLGYVRDSVYFVPNGTIIDYNGFKIFFMGGAMSTDIHARVEGVSWWPGEIATREEMQIGVDNLDENDWDVDFIITHTMPRKCVELFNIRKGYHFTRLEDPMSSYLNFILNQNVRFKEWFCGHFHCDELFGDVRVLYTDIVELKKPLDICPDMYYTEV